MSPRFEPVLHGVRWDDERCGFSPSGRHLWTMAHDDFFVRRRLQGCHWCLAVRATEGTRVRTTLIPDARAGEPGHLGEAALVFEIEDVA